jgi:hypothetical protein
VRDSRFPTRTNGATHLPLLASPLRRGGGGGAGAGGEGEGGEAALTVGEARLSPLPQREAHSDAEVQARAAALYRCECEAGPSQHTLTAQRFHSAYMAFWEKYVVDRQRGPRPCPYCRFLRFLKQWGLGESDIAWPEELDWLGQCRCKAKLSQVSQQLKGFSQHDLFALADKAFYHGVLKPARQMERQGGGAAGERKGRGVAAMCFRAGPVRGRGMAAPPAAAAAAVAPLAATVGGQHGRGCYYHGGGGGSGDSGGARRTSLSQSVYQSVARGARDTPLSAPAAARYEIRQAVAQAATATATAAGTVTVTLGQAAPTHVNGDASISFTTPAVVRRLNAANLAGRFSDCDSGGGGGGGGGSGGGGGGSGDSGGARRTSLSQSVYQSVARGARDTPLSTPAAARYEI